MWRFGKKIIFIVKWIVHIKLYMAHGNKILIFPFNILWTDSLHNVNLMAGTDV